MSAADGKHKVLFTLDGANADFPFLMSDYHLVIQPADSEPNDPIGAGPYIMEESEHGVRYLARKNPNYFGQHGHVDEIETLVINDTTARVTALTTGQAHMISRVDPKIVGQLKRVPNVKIQNISGRGHYVFICHTDTAPFDNRHLRLALKFAIDREDMVKRILHGYGGVGNDFPINAAYPLFPADIPQRAYDPEEARHHYKKSGHSGSILLRTAANAFTGAVDAAVLYQSHAKKPASIWKSSANRTTAIGAAFGMCSPFAPRIGPGARCKIRCTPPLTNPTPTGTTPNGVAPNSMRCC